MIGGAGIGDGGAGFYRCYIIAGIDNVQMDLITRQMIDESISWHI